MYVESKPDSSKGKLHAFYFKDEASAQMVADNVAQVLCGRVQYSMYTAPLCKGLIAVALYQVSPPPLNTPDTRGKPRCLWQLSGSNTARLLPRPEICKKAGMDHPPSR